MPESPPHPPARPYRPTALPPVTARVLAFAAIVVGGICSGLIVYSIAVLQCRPDDVRAATDSACSVLAALAGLVGAIAGALGVAVMAVLALRAMGEWRKDLEADDA